MIIKLNKYPINKLFKILIFKKSHHNKFKAKIKLSKKKWKFKVF